MILFFDTETTGLPKNWKAPVTDLDNWPRLVQLAYLVYDFEGNLIHSCNEIIKPEGFTIPIESSNVHGITTELALQRGSKIADVLELFAIHLKRANFLVAHNMAFDEKIVGAELLRLSSQDIIEQKEKICTMLETIDFCAIEGPYGYKWPKLEELHRKLFGSDFEDAHDALADVQATAKCFWELVKRKEINNHIINVKKEISLEHCYKYVFRSIKDRLDNNKTFDIDKFMEDLFNEIEQNSDTETAAKWLQRTPRVINLIIISLYSNKLSLVKGLENVFTLMDDFSKPEGEGFQNVLKRYSKRREI